MKTIEFFHEHGGTISWTPGEVIQEIWSKLPPEEFERLQMELRNIFAKFINATSGFMLISEQEVRTQFIELYHDHLGSFQNSVLAAVRFQNALSELIDDSDDWSE